MQEEADSPTSTEPPPVVLSSFIHVLGEVFPRTAIEPELDYIVKISNGEIEGWWICGICGSTNRDVEVITSMCAMIML